MALPYGRVVVITGASSGIGRSCALFFARAGYRVWSLSRRGVDAQEAVGAGLIRTWQCDVCDESSVHAAVAHIMTCEKEIGIVIHSAGFGVTGPCEDTWPEAIYRQMETNYFGVLRVNRHILPHMRARGGGLVLVIGSVAGQIAVPFQGHYSSTKFAIEGYVEALRLEGRAHGIRACVLEPGDTKTGFGAARQPSYPADTAYLPACERAVARMASDEQNGHPPEKCARVALRLAARKNPPVRRAVGYYYKLVVMGHRILPHRFMEFILRRIYLK